jgi:hypothetical protein
VEWLKMEAWSSNPNTAKKKKKISQGRALCKWGEGLYLPESPELSLELGLGEYSQLGAVFVHSFNKNLRSTYQMPGPSFFF